MLVGGNAQATPQTVMAPATEEVAPPDAQATSQVVIAPTTDQGTTPMDQTNLANLGLPRLFALKERMDLHSFSRDEIASIKSKVETNMSKPDLFERAKNLFYEIMRGKKG